MKDSFWSWLCWVNSNLIWVSTHDWDSKIDWKIHFIFLIVHSWNNVGLAIFNYRSNFVKCFWGIKQSLSQTHMFVKLDIVFRHNNEKPLLWKFNFSKFKNLFVIVIHFTCECKWSNIYNINFWISASKYSSNLRVFSMFKLFHWSSFNFIYTDTINVNLNSSFGFDFIPFCFELIHHVLPFRKRFLVKFRNFESCVLLKLIKPVFSLNHRSFCH